MIPGDLNILINIVLTQQIERILIIDMGILDNNSIITLTEGIKKTMGGETGILDNKQSIISTKDNKKSFIGKPIQDIILNMMKISERGVAILEMNLISTRNNQTWKQKFKKC